MKRVVLFFVGIFLPLSSHVVLQKTAAQPIKPSPALMYQRYKESAPDGADLVSARDKNFVVIIPSYNNELYALRNLQSVFSQKYPSDRYRAIYINDCSTDRTGDIVNAFKEKHNLGNRLTIITNQQRQWMAYNRLVGARMCKPDEVIIHVDGDDWLIDDTVFDYINHAYKDTNVWMTYGQYIHYPSGKLGYCTDIPEVLLSHPGFIRRNHFWRFMHLRTCYAWLFNLLNESDFKIGAKWLSCSTDVPMMWGLLELAGRHYKFIDKVLYVLNRENVLNVQKSHLDEQLHNARIISKRRNYQPLSKPCLVLPQNWLISSKSSK